MDIRAVLEKWADQGGCPYSPCWKDLLERRKRTFFAFWQKERPSWDSERPPSWSLPETQEMIRTLLWRAVEELVEGSITNDPVHQKEELIDAWNYVLSLPLVSKEGILYYPELVFRMEHVVLLPWFSPSGFPGPPSFKELTWSLVQHSYEVTDRLRARPWQNQKQTHPDIWIPMVKIIQEFTHGVMLSFMGSFEQAYEYFVAKDEVLQFRLKTGY